MIYTNYDTIFEFALSMQVVNHVQKMDYKLSNGIVTVKLFKSGRENQYEPRVKTSGNLILSYNINVIKEAVEKNLKKTEMQNLFNMAFGDK